MAPSRTRRGKAAARSRKQPASAAVAPPAPPPAPLPRRLRWLCAAGVFIIVLCVYQATMLRTVVDIDSGELVAAVHVQGVPHPTGYPLWLLLGRLFDLLPLGHSSAYRVGMMSATGVAAACGVITLLALDLTGMVLPAVFAGLAFGFWSPPWGDSVRAMVHALSGLFVALSLLALRRWHRDRTPRALLWFCLAAGVAAMHHRIAFLVIGPAFLVALVLTPPRHRSAYVALGWLGLTGYLCSSFASGKLDWPTASAGLVVMALAFVGLLVVSLVRVRSLRTPLAAVTAFLAPFSLYLYLWLRARQHPPVYWTDVTTLPRFVQHIFASQYMSLAFQHQGEQVLAEIQKMVPQLLAGPGALSVLMALLGLGLIGWGGWLWWRREPLVVGALAVGTCAALVWVTHWGESSDLKHFLSPIGPALALAGALGAVDLAARYGPKRSPWVIPAVAGALICGGLLRANWTEYDFSNRWGNRDRWAVALLQMEPHAVFVSDFDQPNFVTIYLQNVERLRPDIVMLRAQRLGDRGYVGMIPDPEVREATRAIGFPEFQATPQDLNQEAASFAAQLAARLKDRPVYAVHPPFLPLAAGAPHFLNLSMDLVRVSLTAPDLVRADPGTPALAELPNGAALVSLSLDRGEVGTGETVGFTARWRTAYPMPATQFALALVPEGSSPEQLAAGSTNADVRLLQGFMFLYGQWGLAPSPAGRVYEQRGTLIVPSNASAGRYQVGLGISPPNQPYLEDTTQYVAWAVVPGVTLTVQARPRPANGP